MCVWRGVINIWFLGLLLAVALVLVFGRVIVEWVRGFLLLPYSFYTGEF